MEFIVQNNKESRFIKPYAPTQVILNTKAFLKNLKIAQQRFSHTNIMAIMKSDAYGFKISNLIDSVKKVGIKYCGVGENQEILTLRENGFNQTIMRVRQATTGEIEDILKHLDIYQEVQEMVGNLDLAILMNLIAKKYNKIIPIHLNLNSTCMGRNGLDLSTASGMQDLEEILKLKNLKIVGIMSHFPNASAKDSIYIKKGLETFKNEASFVIKKGGLNRGEILLHIAATSAALKLPDSHLDMIRLGSFIYGEKTETQSPAELEYILTLKSQVTAKMFFPKGSTVGYNSKAVLQRDSILANMPFGKVNGIPFNIKQVLIQGKRFNTVGAMSMNTTMVDITDNFKGISEGDEVIIVGRQEGNLGINEISSQEIISNANLKSLSMLNYYIAIANVVVTESECI